jgi:acyl carrier protein
MSSEIIKQEIRQYIQDTIVQNNLIVLENDTPLISGGIIDSISTLKMVDFLEAKYKIEVQPHEVDRDNLDTINSIAEFVLSKK